MFTSHKKTLLFLSTIFYCILIIQHTYTGLSSLSKNDAYPVFSTHDPHDFLLTHTKLYYRDIKWAKAKGKNARISISPFAQNAEYGKPIEGTAQIECIQTVEELNTPLTDSLGRALGDLTGRTGMIALLYGALPNGISAFPTSLQNARKKLFSAEVSDIMPNTVLTDQTKIDPNQNFGFFSFPLKYRKRGVRFEVGFQIWDDIGLTLQTGVSSICQTVQNKIDKTNKATDPFNDLNKEDVENVLMKQLETIAMDIDLNICNFRECSLEEVRLNIYWRHAYELNKAKKEWAHLLIIPFLEISGSGSPGQKNNSNNFFSLPFGNNNHAAVGFSGGINFDFVESIEIGGEIGYTHFFNKNFEKLRIPTSKLQTTMFPFTADAKVSPGSNWHFSGKIAAYHFVDKLSMYFQYLVVEHKNDSIKLKKEDPAFFPAVLEKTTGWKTKLANIGFTYDISPNILLGFLWQAPLSQRNTYKSTTIMFSFYATF